MYQNEKSPIKLESAEEANPVVSFQVAIIIFCQSYMYLTLISHIKLKSVGEANPVCNHHIAQLESTGKENPNLSHHADLP